MDFFAALLHWALLIASIGALALAGLRTWSFVQQSQRRKKRGRPQKPLDTLTIGLYAVAAVLFLLFLIIPAGSTEAPDATDDPIATDTGDLPPVTTEPTEPLTGWQEDEGGIYYLTADGSRATGWMDMDDRRYYLDGNGYTLSGWQDVEGITRYFREDGSMARGEEEIDGVTYFFTSTGEQIYLVNPWHEVPEDYEVELRTLSVVYATEGIEIDVRIYDALIEMMDACNAEAPRCCVTSGYRTMEMQEELYNNKINNLMYEGVSREEAEAEAATAVAVPGTSEHQIGLAVDIVDTRSWSLETDQEDLPAQQWLIEHSWEYGFILRYPDGKTDVTGIIYEPWHYRYVGKELAKEIHDLGLTLEEYLEQLD